MGKCVDCANLYLTRKKCKAGQPSVPTKFLKKFKAYDDKQFYACRKRGMLRYNWKISKERQCKSFKQRTAEEKYHRKLEVELEKYVKAMKAATIINPELGALYEEVGKREKVASCRELKSMLERVRLLRDGVKWEDEPEKNLMYYIFSYLMDQFRKRCPKESKKYTDELAPKYFRQMEEALLWDKAKPKKVR